MIRGIVVGVLAGLVLGVPAAGAQEWDVPADVLGKTGDQHIEYPPFHSTTHAAPWPTFAGVGDVNGDGLEDIAAGFGGHWDDEHVYVTFSSRLAASGPALAQDGFAIKTDWFWYGLSSAGDVNGDGLGDVAVAEVNRVVVVFGRTDGETVDTMSLGDDGFVVGGVGQSNAGGGNGVYLNSGITLLGDLDGDGVRDLLIGDGRDGAAVVYPPRNAAGTTIDGTVAGPFVSRLALPEDKRLDRAFVGQLGDQDGDGRDDLLFGGEEIAVSDQVAYGVQGPLPGTTVDVPAAVGAGKAFELRTHDGEAGWYGELEQLVTLGDQNGDGRRDVGIVGHDGARRSRIMRLGYSPAFGTRADLHDLEDAVGGPGDARGYAVDVYSFVLDVGDQNGDGRGDYSTSNYVFFTGATGGAARAGFIFSFPNRLGWEQVVAPIADLNGDGKQELAVARVHIVDNPGTGWAGQSGTYALDVFDSAKAPEIPLPDVDVQPDGEIEVPVELGTGAGSRGGTTLAVWPRLELATPDGPAHLAGDAGVIESTGASRSVTMSVDGEQALGGRPLQPGETYRARYRALNGRGLAAAGPWRTFVYDPSGSSTEPPPKDEEPPPKDEQPPPKDEEPPPKDEQPPPPKDEQPAQEEKPPAEQQHPGRQDPVPPVVLPPVPLPPVLAEPGRLLLGTAAADRMAGTPGGDFLRGMGGHDVIDGGAGDDRLDGGSGRDRLLGRGGDDRLAGGTGADTILPGHGADRVDAGRGDDLVRARDGRRDVIRCGPGRDTVVADAVDRLAGCERRR